MPGGGRDLARGEEDHPGDIGEVEQAERSRDGHRCRVRAGASGCLTVAAVWVVAAEGHPGDPARLSSPNASARATASALDDAPSLRYSSRVCVLTVFSEM